MLVSRNATDAIMLGHAPQSCPVAVRSLAQISLSACGGNPTQLGQRGLQGVGWGARDEAVGDRFGQDCSACKLTIC